MPYGLDHDWYEMKELGLIKSATKHLIKHIWRIEKERRRLMRDKTPWWEQSEHGAGSKFAGQRTVGDVARQSTTPFWKCLILYWFARRASIVLELGTGLGLSTAYLAIGGCAELESFDADDKAQEIAKRFVKSSNIFLYNETFDTALCQSPEEIYGFAYIDGDHKGENLVRYFKKLLLLMSSKGVILCDDVLWSEDMERGWLRCCCHPDVRRHLRIHDLGILWLK